MTEKIRLEISHFADRSDCSL